MRSRSPEEVRRWLDTEPPLEELRSAYPAVYDAVQREVSAIVGRGDLEELKAYVLRLAAPAGSDGSRRERRATAAGRSRAEDLVRRHIAAAALKQVCATAATGVSGGRLRFNLLNGWVAQKLLFERDLDRKPVSMGWFRLLWPLLWQRSYLMPLVGPKGIYCFYSKPLVRALAEIIGDRSCLEIAAGDGTLSRFLRAAGVDVVATDDHSWSSVRFTDAVLREDAREALRSRRPEVVLCSWPPAGNPFEREVFATPSVELYVVISSRHEFASGDWAAYRAQEAFEFAEQPELSRLVLPPELDAAVYVFRRVAPS